MRKQLNSQLEITSKYSNYQEKIKNLKSQFDLYSLQGNFWADKAKEKINFLSVKKENFSNFLQMEINLFDTNNNFFKFIHETVVLNEFVLIKNFRWVFLNFIKENLNQIIIISLQLYTSNFNTKKSILDLSRINRLAVKPVSENVNKNDNLTKFSLDKIIMLGFLSVANQQKWGFVKLPNKKICKVKLGDYLGLERGLVVGVYTKKIIIIKNNNLKKVINLSNKNKNFLYVKNFT